MGHRVLTTFRPVLPVLLIALLALAAPVAAGTDIWSTTGPFATGAGDWYNTTDASARNATHTYTAAGTYTVSLTVANAGGSNTMTRAGYITVISVPGLPTAGFSGTPASGRVPLDVAFTNESDIFAGTVWNWSFGDGSWENTTLSTNPVHNYASAGTYTAALTVTNASGSSTMTRAGYIIVSVPPTPSPTPTPVVTTTTATGGFSIGGGGSDSGGSPGTTGQQRSQHAPVQEESSTVSVNVGGNTPVSNVVVTGTGIKDTIVTATQASGPGLNIQPPPGTIYMYLDLTPARYGTITGATITFTVPQSWLDQHHLTPQDIVLYHNVGKEWQALPITVAKTENGQVFFSATSPGFSRFAIGGLAHAKVTLVTTVSAHGQTPGSSVKSPSAVSAVPAAPSPVARETSAVPAPAAPDTGFPFITAALVAVGGVGLIGGGMLVRRWWIRRQNPALFREYN